MNEFEFEIKPGERLSLDTKMEIPEMSFEQELISEPVPFQNRIDHLSDYDSLRPKAEPIWDIAGRVGKELKDVKKRINDLGARVVGEDNKGRPLYEPFTTEVLEADYHWRGLYKSLDSRLPTSAIADIFGRKANWVVRNATALGIFPREGMYRGRSTQLYFVDTVRKLRLLELQIPPARHHYSITELQELTGKDHRWIENVFAHNAISPEWRENLTTRVPGWHYRKDEISVLYAALEALPEVAGSMLTEADVVRMTGLSKRLIGTIIDREPHLAELRLNIQSKPSRHFRDESIAAIQAEANVYPDQITYTYDEIAQLARRSIHWVRNKAIAYKDNATRKGHNKAFGEDVKDAILDIAKSEPRIGGDWLTVEDIARMLQKRRNWVVSCLGEIGIASEVRLDVRMKPREHYHPDVIDTLQLEYLVCEENEEAIKILDHQQAHSTVYQNAQ